MWALWTRRSRMASGTVGSDRRPCQWSGGSWLATMVERAWARSSSTSRRYTALGVGEGGEAPVVEDQEVDAGQLVEEPGVGAVAPGDAELGQERGAPGSSGQ